MFLFEETFWGFRGDPLIFGDIFVLKHVVLPRNEQKLRIFSSQNTTFSLKIQRGRHLRPFEA